MTNATGAIAVLLLSGIFWSMPAAAQYMPQGTYLQSCNNVGIEGDSLIATCRRGDGGDQRSALNGVHRCVGDIGNNNGILQCQHASGRQAFGQPVDGRPGYATGYGSGYGSSRWERCGGLRRESEQLRARLEGEWNPVERARLEDRLRGLHEQEESCR